mgnify:FL=1
MKSLAEVGIPPTIANGETASFTRRIPPTIVGGKTARLSRRYKISDIPATMDCGIPTVEVAVPATIVSGTLTIDNSACCCLVTLLQPSQVMDEQILPYDILRFDYKEHLSDRFLATHLHRFEMFSKPVAIVVLVEIINPWHPASELGRKILNSLVREFLRTEANSYLTRFETTLKETNRAVQEALNQTKSPVSSVAVLLESDQIHSSGIGTAKLGLQRNGKLATIIGSKNTYNENFATVTSGDMRKNDWLLIANDTFYSILAGLDSKVWLDDEVTAIGTKISQLDQLNNDQKSAGVLLHFNADFSTINQLILWGESSPPKSNRSRLDLLVINFGALTKLVVRLGGLISRTWRSLVKDHFRQDDPPPESNSTSTAKLLGLGKRYLPIILIFIVLAVGIWIGFQRFRDGQAGNSTKTSLYTELRDLPADKLLNGLVEKFTLDAYQSLDDEDKTELADLLKNQLIFLADEPATITDMPRDIVALETLNNQLLIIDSQGQIWVNNGSLLTQIAQRTLITDPVSLTAFDQAKIIATDTAGNIWRLDGTNNQPLALTQESPMATGPKLVDNYQGNLYLTNLVSKTTYRVNKFAGDLAGVAIYNKAENLSLVAKPSDIAINGKVLIADSDGLVVEFARNTVSKTKFQAPFVDGPVKIAASEGATFTVLGSGRTIYLFDSNDAGVGTIFLVSNAKIADIVLDPTSPTKFWVAAGSQIYHLSLSSSL